MSFQGSLLDLAADPAVGELGPGLRRTTLAHGAWLDLQRGWIRGADTLFEELLGVGPGATTPRDPLVRRPLGPGKPAVAAVAWRAERRRMYDRVVDVPRLVCHYGAGEELPHPVLARAMDALSARYREELGELLCTAGLCLYRDGRDSVAWHGDNSGRQVPRTVVAIVSLGAPRALLLRPVAGGSALRFDLGHGDLLVMGGTCQRSWQHAIPKTARATGPRISVQFRAGGIR